MVDATVGASQRVFSDAGVEVSAVEFASGADILVMHLGASQQAPPFVAQVHARPATVGQVAQSAKAKILVLSHFIKAPSVISTPQWFSLFNLGDSIAEVRKTFSGLIEAAEDLQCIRIP